MSEHWKSPEGGSYQVAIREDLYQRRTQEIDGFFGRPLWKRDHHVVFEGICYVVFGFKGEADAAKFAATFAGEPFDPRDMGSGTHWTRWYKGRAAKRRARRDPYDFSSKD